MYLRPLKSQRYVSMWRCLSNSYSVIALVCATRLQLFSTWACLCHKIWSQYSSRVLVHFVRGFSILLMSVIVCSNCQFVPKAFQKPGVRWLYTLSGGTYRVVLSSIGLFRATRSDHPLVLVRQNPLGTL